MCKVFSHFSGFLHHFALAELATSSIRVNNSFKVMYGFMIRVYPDTDISACPGKLSPPSTW